MDTYCIVRTYFDTDRFPNHIIQEDLSLAEARRWCSNPETSSETCGPFGNKITRDCGPWFDMYMKQE